LLVVGGVFGGSVGILLAQRLSKKSGLLQLWYAVIVLLVAGYMLYRSAWMLAH
jgi:hypothetical protein